MKSSGFLLFRIVAIALTGIFLLAQTFSPAFLQASTASGTQLAHLGAAVAGLAFLLQAAVLAKQLRSAS